MTACLNSYITTDTRHKCSGRIISAINIMHPCHEFFDVRVSDNKTIYDIPEIKGTVHVKGNVPTFVD